MKSTSFFKSRHDRLFFLKLLPVSMFLISILVTFFAVVLLKSDDALKNFGLSLLYSDVWNPELEIYGLLPPIVGTFVTSVIAVATALALSIPLTIFIAEVVSSNFLRNVLLSTIELMGGIPTVIYAVWGLNTLAPFLRDYVMMPLSKYLRFIPIFSCEPLTGTTVLTAGLLLGVANTPYLTAITYSAYQSIPITYKEACLGIGATKYETVRILLPLLRPAIAAATLLGLARAMGDTTIAAVTIGNSMTLNACILLPGYTVSALIASQFGNASFYRYAESVLYLGALIILITALVLSFIGLLLLSKWRVRIVV